MKLSNPNPKDFNISSYTESIDLLGNSLGIDAIPRLVKHFDFTKCFFILSQLCWLLETFDRVDNEIQLKAAASLLKSPTKEKARQLIRETNKAIFFPTQILTFMKYLALYGRENYDIKNMSKEEVQKIGLAALAITDLISLEYRKKTGTLDKEDHLRYVALEIITTSYFQRSPNLSLLVSRAMHLYVNIHTRLKEKQHPNFFDIEVVFFKATGVQLEDYLAIGISLFVHYSQHWNAKEIPSDLSFLYFHPEIFFGSSQLDNATLNKVLEMVAITIEDFRDAVKKQSRRELAYDFLVMKGKPLIKISEDGYLPFSLNFLVDRLTMGVYWIIFDFASSTDEYSHLEFSTYNGAIFEEYVSDVVEQICKRDTVAFFKEQKYYIKKEELLSSDILLFGEDYAIFIEVSAKRLQAKRTTALGETSSFDNDVEGMVFQKARQIDKSIKNFKAGHLRIDGIDSEKIKSIYPVIVTIEGFPKLSIFDLYFVRELENKKLLQDTDVMPLSILDIEDIEQIEGYTKLTLEDALRNWHQSERMKDIPLGTYVVDTYGDSSELKSDWLNEISKNLFNRATNLVFGKSIEEIEKNEAKER